MVDNKKRTVMNTITRLVVCLIILLTVATGNAQKEQDSLKQESTLKKEGLADIDQEIQKLIALKSKVEAQEREYLKQDIARINKRLDNDEITPEEAENLKKEAAVKRAKNIEDKRAIIDKKIAIYKRTDRAYEAGLPRSDSDQTVIRIGGSDETSESFIYIGKREFDKPRKYDRRTTSDIVFAFGLNNTLIDGQDLGDSPYKIAGSGFMELGYAWKTRIFDNTNFWRLKYGFSFQWNKLDIKDNQYFVNTNGDIALQEFPAEVNKVKFRTTNLVFPVHMEFGPSKKIEGENYFRYSTRKKYKIGLGAYAGLNIGSMQKLKYKEDGNRIKDKQRGGFEVNEFVYGVSSYVAWGSVALYAKYDLNPLFKNQMVDQNNISLGVRFDMD